MAIFWNVASFPLAVLRLIDSSWPSISTWSSGWIIQLGVRPEKGLSGLSFTWLGCSASSAVGGSEPEDYFVGSIIHPIVIPVWFPQDQKKKMGRACRKINSGSRIEFVSRQPYDHVDIDRRPPNEEFVIQERTRHQWNQTSIWSLRTCHQRRWTIANQFLLRRSEISSTSTHRLPIDLSME